MARQRGVVLPGYRLESITYSDELAMPASSFSYDYDVLGRITHWDQWQSTDSSYSTDFTNSVDANYDLVSRLTQWNGASSASSQDKKWNWMFDKDPLYAILIITTLQRYTLPFHKEVQKTTVQNF